MKPRYFLRNVKFYPFVLNSGKDELFRLWNKLKNDDCVIAVTKDTDGLYKKTKYVICYDKDTGKAYCFARLGKFTYMTDSEDDIKVHLKKEKIFVDNDKWMVMDL